MPLVASCYLEEGFLIIVFLPICRKIGNNKLTAISANLFNKLSNLVLFREVDHNFRRFPGPSLAECSTHLGEGAPRAAAGKRAQWQACP